MKTKQIYFTILLVVGFVLASCNETTSETKETESTTATPETQVETPLGKLTTMSVEMGGTCSTNVQSMTACIHEGFKEHCPAVNRNNEKEIEKLREKIQQEKNCITQEVVDAMGKECPKGKIEAYLTVVEDFFFEQVKTFCKSNTSN